MRRDLRGFSLVELLVVMVLGSLLILAALQVLITNQRASTAQSAQIQGQQTLRAASDVLFNELREVSAQGGDLLSMSSTAVTIRAMRKLGIVCAVSVASPPVLTAMRQGPWFQANDSVFVFADNNTNISSDDRWIAAQVTGVDTTRTCGTNPAQNLSFTGQAAIFTADSVRVGAPVRSFLRYTYGLVTYSGQTYLGRTEPGGTATPLVGPLRPSDGLAFVFLDSLGAVTGTATKVRQIRLTIRTTSTVRNALGRMVSDSLITRIYTRN